MPLAVPLQTAARSARVTVRPANPWEGEMQNPLSEYNPEMEMFESEQFEWSGETMGETLGEGELMELAAELLEVRDEQELDRFLGKIVKGIKKVAASPIGGLLKKGLKTLLPIAAGAAGTFFGGPLGGKIASGLASKAGSLLGLELEGLSHEDREFEAAKQFVRFASEAVKNAATAPGGNPASIARSAIVSAAQRHAPGLLNAAAPMSGGSAMSAPSSGLGRPRTGRWRRVSGNRILVENI
jgi:hypothetical protein